MRRVGGILLTQLDLGPDSSESSQSGRWRRSDLYAHSYPYSVYSDASNER
jgi:hypothetical protein